MKTSTFLFIALFGAWASAQTPGVLNDGGQPAALPAPDFHHLHLNSMDPDAAIAFYTRQFPTTVKSSFAGFPALKSGNAYVLFTKVNTPPATEPQTALWHFGWYVVDIHKNFELYQQRPDVRLLPLYTGDEGGTVFVSSDTLPGTGGLGSTKAQIAELKAKGAKPAGGGGFAYIEGPDHAIVEYQGNMPAERFNHVHLYQNDPYCAVLWYQKHLNAPVQPARGGAPPRTESNCKAERAEPSWPALEKEGLRRQPGNVAFGDVAIQWLGRQGDAALVSSRGHVADHIALSVSNLDAWIAKLRAEGVQILEQPYKVGDSRAVMIEGPSREAIELIEIK